MRKIIVLFILIQLLSLKINSQVIDVVTGLSEPIGLTLDDESMYISEFGTNKILKFNIETGTINDFVAPVISPIGILIRRNDLLIAENNGFKISRKDLTTPLSFPTDYVILPRNSFPEPWGIELSEDENTLYISIVDGRIFKVDLTQENLVPELIWENLDGTTIDLDLYGNDLYISESESNISGKLGRIFKIDISQNNPTPVDVITNLSFPSGLEIIGTELFFTNCNNLENGTDTLNKIDLTNPNPEPITLLNNLNLPSYLTYSNTNELYISQSDRVSKISLDVLGVNTKGNISNIKFFPNPAYDYIKISGTNVPIKFEIFNLFGAKVMFGTSTYKINIIDLKSGMYFLKTGNETHKFLKL